jgi:hypothetical protein
MHEKERETKMAVWIVALIIVLMMETASISETSVHFYQTIRRNKPQNTPP